MPGLRRGITDFLATEPDGKLALQIPLFGTVSVSVFTHNEGVCPQSYTFSLKLAFMKFDTEY